MNRLWRFNIEPLFVIILRYKLGPVTELQSPAPEKFQKRVGFWLELFKKEMAKENQKPEVFHF